MEIRRGDVYYVTSGIGARECGSEQHSGRPAIIVSNNRNNEFSPVVEVVYLTTKPKTRLPTHIDVLATGRNSIAICEQITSVSVERLGDYIGALSELETEMLNAALEISLDLSPDASEDGKKTAPAATAEDSAQPSATADTAFGRVTAERDLYKTLYEQLLNRIIR